MKLGSERFRATEILFDPELIGLEYPGVHQIVVDAINRTDMDLRKNLFANIVMSGGSTLTKGTDREKKKKRVMRCNGSLVLTLHRPGFGDRLLNEVRRLAVKDMKIKIFAPPERKYSTWIGGSILAGLSTFRKVRLSFPPSLPPCLRTSRWRHTPFRHFWRAFPHLDASTAPQLPRLKHCSLAVQLRFVQIRRILLPSAGQGCVAGMATQLGKNSSD